MSPVDLSPSLPSDRRFHLGSLHAFMNEEPKDFPLKSCTLRSHIHGIFCRHQLTQTFHNPHDQILDVTYIFPLPPNATVSELSFKVGDMEIKAQCTEKQEAIEAYEEAQSKGQTVSLLTQERGDVYTLNVANIPAGQQIDISFNLNELLSISDGQLKYRFPTTIAPRYSPGDAVGHSGPGTAPDTTQVPDASFVSPPVVLDNGATFQAEVHISTPVKSVASALHATKVAFDQGIIVSLSQKAKLDSDFILSFELPIDQLHTSAWTDGTYTSILLTPKPEEILDAPPREAVFVVDISGSMDGDKMKAAKLALSTAIRSLMPQDRFRLIAFDDRIEVFKDDFSAVTDDELNAAEHWINGLKARGGTEMLPAIKKSFEHQMQVGFQRTILFITDGQAWNEDELIAAISHRRKGARFFTLGIDTAVNENLLGRMAKAGEGTCELCTPSDNIEERVALIESRMGNPLLSAIQTDADGSGVTIPPLFPGRPIGFVVKGIPSKISAKSGKTNWSQDITPQKVDSSLGIFWAKQRVDHLEERITLKPHEAEGIRPDILELGLAFTLITKYTALIAIDPREQSRQNAISVVQAHPLPQAWNQGTNLSFSMGAMPPPQMSPTRARAPRGGKQKLFSKPLANSAPPPGTKGSFYERVSNLASSFFSIAESEPMEDLPSQNPSPSPAPAKTEAPAPKISIAALIKCQKANGSINNDLAESVLTLLIFILEGNTRKSGTRRRNVIKLVMWLDSQGESELKTEAMTTLEAAERGEYIAKKSSWESIAPQSIAHRFLSVH